MERSWKWSHIVPRVMIPPGKEKFWTDMLIDAVRARFNRLSVLSNVVRDVGRVAADPARHIRRIAAARSFGGTGVEIDRQTGFALSDANKIEGLAVLLPKLQAFALRRA